LKKPQGKLISQFIPIYSGRVLTITQETKMDPCGAYRIWLVSLVENVLSEDGEDSG